MARFNYSITIISQDNDYKEKIEYLESFAMYTKQQLLDVLPYHDLPIEIEPLLKYFPENIAVVNENEELGNIITDALSIISTITLTNNRFNYKQNKAVMFFEYYKLFIQDIKFDYSILVNLQNSKEIIEQEQNLVQLTFSFLNYIKEKYEEQTNTSKISDQIHELLNFMNKVFTHEIKMTLNTSEIIIANNFLYILRNTKLSSKYFYGKKCFALAFKGSFYYAVSGYDYQKPNQQIEKLGKQIVGALTVEDPIYCITNDKTPSYGYLDDSKNFVKYENVIMHKNCKTQNINNVKKQYACCERKILSCILLKNCRLRNYYKLRFIIKYAPCIDCSLALTKFANNLPYGIDIKYFFDGSKSFDNIKKYIHDDLINNVKNGNHENKVLKFKRIFCGCNCKYVKQIENC